MGFWADFFLEQKEKENSSLYSRSKVLSKAKKMVGNRLTINDDEIKKLKGPIVFIASYKSHIDTYAIALALKDYKIKYVVGIEELPNRFSEPWKELGYISRKKKDLSIQKNNILYFPGRIGSIVGTNTSINYLYEKLYFSVSYYHNHIVLITTNGGYLSNPIWSDDHINPVPIEVNFKYIGTFDDSITSEKTIINSIDSGLTYNDYKYQLDKGIKIEYPKRALGLHRALYQCINCGTKYKMKSMDSTLECEECHSKWTLNSLGELTQDDLMTNISIPDWYEWQRLECQKYVKELSLTKRSYKIKKEFKVHVKVNYKDKTEIHIGSAELSLNNQEFTLYFNCSTTVDKIYNNMQIKEPHELHPSHYDNKVLRRKSKSFHFPHNTLDTIQIVLNNTIDESKGIILSNDNCTFFIYCDDEDFEPAELQLLTEAYD